MTRFEVPFNALRFPASVSPRGVLKFDESDLAHALFVTGRAPGDRLSYGFTSVWEWIHRVSVIPAYIRNNWARELFRSTLAESLDRSEKMMLSYALGQALTGIFCEQRLQVTHLMHMDRYAARWDVVLGPGRSRPDLFGATAAEEWVVAEAKGRSNAMESGLARKLREQKGMVREVDGRPPSVTLGCVAHFPPLSSGLRGPLRGEAVDPEPEEKALTLKISKERFLRAYYEPFVAAIEMGQPSALSSDEVMVASFPALGLSVGLLREVYAAAQIWDESSPGWSDLLAEGRRAQEAGGGAVRSDGTFVRAQWSGQFEMKDIERG